MRVNHNEFKVSFNYTVQEDDSELMKSDILVEENRFYFVKKLSDAIELLKKDNDISLDEKTLRELNELSIEEPKNPGDLITEIIHNSDGKNFVFTDYTLKVVVERLMG